MHMGLITYLSQKSSMPVVSVVMPVYNAEKYVTEAIESILNQTFNDFEFIIIDDGSSDRSVEIIKGYEDPRIRFIRHEENVNLVGTLNEGIGLSNGKYIARMDADDISDPQRLRKQVDFLENHPEVGATGTWANAINHPEWSHLHYFITDEEIRIRMVEQIPFAHPTVMMRKDVLEAHNLKYDQEFLEDYRLWFELSKVTLLANVPEYLLNYRFHEKQFSKRFQKFHRENSLGLQKEILGQWAGRLLSDIEASILINILSDHSSEQGHPIEIICSLLAEIYMGMTHNSHIRDEKAGEYLKHHAYRVCTAHYFEGWNSLNQFSRLPFIKFWTFDHFGLHVKLTAKIILKKMRITNEGK